MKLSVVIITKNEAHIIGKTLESIRELTDDIVIVDSGSTDDTLSICRKYNTNILHSEWLGYGAVKNKGISAARYDWILSLDADELIDAKLERSLKSLPLEDEHTVYNIRFKNFFRNKWIRYGEWSGEKHIRLFNRNKVKWNDAAVHEGLILDKLIKVSVIESGSILHYTVHNLEEYMQKTIRYAQFNGEKYFLEGRKVSGLKLFFGSTINFILNYFLRLGFLDGWEGFIIAKTQAYYTFVKYAYLKELIRSRKQ